MRRESAFIVPMESSLLIYQRQKDFVERKNQKNLDRMEQEGIDFHHMVSEGYRKVLSGRPEVMKIDGGRSIDTIQKKIRNHVDELLKKKNR